MGLDICKQRVSHTTCARCRKGFQAGDRIMPAYIVLNPNTRNPETKELAAEMSGEFEFVHAACADPSLEGRIVIAG